METDQRSRPGKVFPGENPALRLLVVEDHSDLRGALQAYVGMLGYPAHFVEDVASALLVGDDDPYDVLLCDIGLPDGTGWDLLRTLATQSTHLFCCLHAFAKLERIRAAATPNHFAIKARIYHAGLKKMLCQLRTLPSASFNNLATA